MTKNLRIRFELYAIFFILGVAVCAGGASAGDFGPEKGHLVIIGGAMHDPEIFGTFLRLAGGEDAPIIIIPTAGGGDHYDQSWSGMAGFRDSGARNLVLLHTYDREEADSEEFAAPIRRAAGVFFTGGRQWRLADAYLNTRTHRELEALLDRGGVIGGSSAGATIQGSFLVRGDTKTNTIMIGDHREGFGFLKKVGIDQHLLKRNRHFDMLQVIREYPDLLGIGIDEDTAIVVHGDQFEVIGQGYVAVYDRSSHILPEGPFYFLAPGDHYNIKKREATRPARVMRPLERVTKKEKKK